MCGSLVQLSGGVSVSRKDLSSRGDFLHADRQHLHQGCIEAQTPAFVRLRILTKMKQTAEASLQFSCAADSFIVLRLPCRLSWVSVFETQ